MIMQNVHRIDMEVQLNALTSQFTSLFFKSLFQRLGKQKLKSVTQ